MFKFDKFCTAMEIIWIVFFVLSFSITKSKAFEKGCPPPEDILPCTCNSPSFNYLSCLNIDNSDLLRDIFIRSSRYRYYSVRLENAVLQYLPSDMFQGVQVRELQLVNVTLVELFDEIPENLQMLDTLHIENTHIFRGVSWEHLRNLTNLRILNIYYNRIPILGEEIKEYVSKNLKQLTFYETDTEMIVPGILEEFNDLEKIAVEKCELTELSRNMFPSPFNGRYLHFNYNKLRVIPNDLFNDMPNLQTVGLKGNMIATIPQISSLMGIEYLLLEGNPMECDCRIYWMMKYKPAVLTGECYKPQGLQGLPLKDLDYKKFNCPPAS